MFQYQPKIPGGINRTLRLIVQCAIKQAAAKLVPPNHLCFTHVIRSRRLPSYNNYACLQSKLTHEFEIFRSRGLVIGMHLPKSSTVSFSITERKSGEVKLSRTYENVSGLFGFLPFLEGDIESRHRLDIRVVIDTNDSRHVFDARFHAPKESMDDYVGIEFVSLLDLSKDSQAETLIQEPESSPMVDDDPKPSYYSPMILRDTNDDSHCFNRLDSPITQEQYDCYTCFMALNPDLL